MVHQFLRAIGFRGITKNADLYKILEDAVGKPDEQALVEDTDGNEFVCFSKSLGEDFGISVCGSFLNEHEFRMEYYYPYFRGSRISTLEPVDLERHASREAYAGICDELKLGVTLIFYVENIIDLLSELKRTRDRVSVDTVVLSGLSNEGKILLPVMKTKEISAKQRRLAEKRMNLMQQAREGDYNAIENLTMNDMDTYSALSRRIAKEDILTIVETSFIPCGIESDQYIIIGEIQSCYRVLNPVSREAIWILSLLCNGMAFDVCINEKDLIGEPEVGRRFKGRIWMQGYLNFGY